MATNEQLERKILELENRLNEQSAEAGALLKKSKKALDLAMHAYKLDGYGFIWQWDVQTQTYHKTKMRVVHPEIADRAIHPHHIADGAVTGDKIDGEAVIPGKIADNAVMTRNINDKAVTREKLSDELWIEIGRLAWNELLVAVFGVTTYETALYYYENEKIIIGKSEDLYFNMVRFDDGEFVFTQVDERGTLHTMVLSENGWSDSVAQMELATGDIDMEIRDVDEMINN